MCLYVSGKRHFDEYLDSLSSLFSLRIFCKIHECVSMLRIGTLLNVVKSGYGDFSASRPNCIC